MNKTFTLTLLVGCCAALSIAQQRLTPLQLQAARDGGQKFTLIDLRSQADYAKGTLPDALHMTAREALEKSHVGSVVFFDAGLGVNRARRAAESFAAAGKAAAELAGGYAAWQAAGLATTERKGLSIRPDPYVTYQDLAGEMANDAADVVLVDAREAAPGPARGALFAAAEEGGASSTNAAAAPVDLAAEFPGYRVSRQPLAAAPQRGALSAGGEAAGAAQPLYVVIDAGDGKASKRAAELRAAGCARVVVLAGGETIIRRKGQAGLVRRGPGTGLATDQEQGQSKMATISQEVTP